MRVATSVCALLLLLPGSEVVSGEIDFDTEIVPVFSKAGCNAAACHGGAAGQAGFRLSLFGGDPDLDFRMIVRELEGRRIDLARPEESLLFAKPTGLLDHGGGYVLASDSDEARAILTWIAENAERRRLRRLESVAVEPSRFSGLTVPADVRVRVNATFDDGTSRDVTNLATFRPLDESAVEIGDGGAIRVVRPGRQVVVVRFAGRAVPLSFTSPLGTAPAPGAHEAADAARRNWIDDAILATLAELRLPVAPPSSDDAFVRRVTLDLAGRLPTLAEQQAFHRDARPDKRERLVERLLESSDFVAFWTYRFARLLRIRPPGPDRVAPRAMAAWLQEQLSEDAAWTEIARALILAEGDSHLHGEATFHRLHATPGDQAEYVSEVFLGIRLRCANCHNHPLDRWTQDDYHGLAQVFARLERGRMVRAVSRGEVIHPRTGLAAIAQIPGGRRLDNSTAREDFADWLVADDNPYFARAMAGRVWKMLMGRGLVEPTDDVRATNPASHPELLDRLATHFADRGYRVKELVRVICNSAAYARSSTVTAQNAMDDRFYSRALIRPLDAAVLADAISDVTGIRPEYDPSQPGMRAISVIDAEAASELDVLGRCDRRESCESQPATTSTIARQLHLMNGPLINARLANPAGRLAKRIAAGTPTREIIEEFYRRALCRSATRGEMEHWLAKISGEDDLARHESLEDFAWSVLNCREFLANH